MWKFLLFLLLGIVLAALAPEAIVWARPGIVPREVDLTHVWGDVGELLWRIVTLRVHESVPIGEARLMAAIFWALIIASCLAAYLAGGLAALLRWATPLLVLGLLGCFWLYTNGYIALSLRADARAALEMLLLAMIIAASAGNLWARALRHLQT